MLFGFLKNTPLLDDESVQWLFDSYAWSLKHFDAAIFFNETVLVLPTDEHFPGRENTVLGMANLILEQVKGYARLNHWPCRLIDASRYAITEVPQVTFEGARRGSQGLVPDTVDDANKLIIPFTPQQVGNPEALIASYAHALAHYLGTTANEPPPGGEAYWPQVTELLAVFMGFGVMMANSAYTFRGGCGSCYNPLANRSAFLSEGEMTYALAIFGVLKDIPDDDVLRHLKKHLRPVFKKAVREINERREDLKGLKPLNHGAISNTSN